MSKAERIGLWVAFGFLFVWLLVLTVVTAGEFAAVNRVLREGAAGGPRTEGWSRPASEPMSASPTPWWGGEPSGEPVEPGVAASRSESFSPALPEGIQVGIAGVRVLSDTLAMTVTVRSSGAGDLLYEPPVLVDEAGQVYQVTPDSLEEARLAFLDLVTRGQAEAELVFFGAPPKGTRLVLVFNPGQQPGDIIAPRVEVGVPVMVEGER
ncbi:MAG TPA: hypothetical protein G4O00_13660 [Thermoflexia bacterium]|jgi:hypothetical protein|nr:hypothetical protein [Thermoflexia bacterium]